MTVRLYCNHLLLQQPTCRRWAYMVATLATEAAAEPTTAGATCATVFPKRRVSYQLHHCCFYWLTNNQTVRHRVYWFALVAAEQFISAIALMWDSFARRSRRQKRISVHVNVPLHRCRVCAFTIWLPFAKVNWLLIVQYEAIWVRTPLCHSLSLSLLISSY